MNNPSPTGSGAPAWRTHCGSFVVNGHFGAVNDYVLQMFITCTDPPRQPTRIVCGDSTYSYFVQAWMRQTANLAKHIAWILEKPDEWMIHINAAGLDSVTEIIRHLSELQRLMTAERPSYLYGAEVVHDREVREDTMLFFENERLVGECSGWTA